VEDFDSPANYWDRWKLGGWDSNTWEQHSGLTAVTESPPNPDNGNTVNTTSYTYSVMTLDRVIDLRGLSASDHPTLYFWTNYRLGNSDEAFVQIATENTGYSPTGGDGRWDEGGNYQRIRGWNAWQNIWSLPQWSRNEAWHRPAIDLESYAGERIKVRFVYDKLNGNTQRDGWNVDDVIVEQRSTIPEPLPFLDSAKGLGNWIVEGDWGLAPDQWRGTGGGPADMGGNFWSGVYYDCERHLEVNGGNRCNNITHFNNLLYSNYSAGIERAYNGALDIQEFTLEIDHDFGSNGRPNGGALDPTWANYYAGRWKRPITLTNQADITFISVTDDGIRLKYSGPGAPNGWNIIENWSYHGRFVNIATRTFNPGNYNLTLEWFEASGDATIILSAGINNFSFTDSPKAGNGPGFQPIDSIRQASSSMIMRRPISLTGATRPVIQYYTRFKMNGATGRFEVSANGGFDWTQNNLTANTNGFSCPPSPGTPPNIRNEDGSGLPSMTTCSPVAQNMFWPYNNSSGEEDLTIWQQRQHNLSNYIANGLINIRFRLETQGSVDDGWYVTDIEISP
jgi:hypothetical protein